MNELKLTSMTRLGEKLTGRAEPPKKRKAPAKKPVGEKVPRAKKGEKKEKGKSVDSAVEEVPALIVQ